MSGGRFNYDQSNILAIADQIESEIYRNDAKKFRNDDFRGFSTKTIKEFSNAIKALRKAYVYAQRIDWLLSYDDGEETFHKCLKKDLGEL